MSTFAIVSLLLGNVFSAPLPFDGLIRPVGDGSSIAYMNPVTGVSNHASFLEQFPPSAPYELGLAWFSGTSEGADKCSIVYSRLPKGSQQWTDPVIISIRDGYSNQNPVLFFDASSNKLHCFHSQQLAKSGESAAQIWHLQTSNYGTNWTEPEALFTFPGAFPKNRILPAMSTKGVLFPIYNAAKNTPLIAKSSDMNLGNKNSWTLYPIANADSLVQPSIIRLPGSSSGKLKAFFRDRRKVAIYEATSTDDGQSWETPYSFQLPNPNVAIQANTISDGGPIILLFNDYNGKNQLGRTPMSIGFSYDDGTTWPNIRMLQVHNDNATSIPVNGGLEYSYPSVMQTSDGYIHSSYTYNRQTIKYLKYNITWALVG